jgi:hypothetical protein
MSARSEARGPNGSGGGESAREDSFHEVGGCFGGRPRRLEAIAAIWEQECQHPPCKSSGCRLSAAAYVRSCERGESYRLDHCLLEAAKRDKQVRSAAHVERKQALSLCAPMMSASIRMPPSRVGRRPTASWTTSRSSIVPPRLFGGRSSGSRSRHLSLMRRDMSARGRGSLGGVSGVVSLG